MQLIPAKSVAYWFWGVLGVLGWFAIVVKEFAGHTVLLSASRYQGAQGSNVKARRVVQAPLVRLYEDHQSSSP